MYGSPVPIRSLKILPAVIIGLIAFVSGLALGDRLIPDHGRITFYSVFFIGLSIYSLTPSLAKSKLTVASTVLYIFIHIVAIFIPWTGNKHYYGVILTPLAIADLALMYSMLYYTYRWHCHRKDSDQLP
jgi:hypothetical protein